MHLLYLVFIDPFVQMGSRRPTCSCRRCGRGSVGGMLYALIALGFVLIFKASGVFNFAQGIMVVFAALTLVGLYDAWRAGISRAGPDHRRDVPAGLRDRAHQCCGRLVNQPDIILFMATFGTHLFPDRLRRIYLRRRSQGDDHRSICYFPRAPSPIKTLGGIVQLQKLDIAAAVIASVMVAGLGVFFSKTRIGRALRAVADSHRAALSVGISLEQIWVIVWFAAGLVALVTGIIWGARSDVSFALEMIALKALPVLILGGFTSIPGAIVGGADYRHRREDRRILLGPARRRRHRVVVRLRHRAGLPAVPSAGTVRRTHHRAGMRADHVLSRSRANSRPATPAIRRCSRSARIRSASCRHPG